MDQLDSRKIAFIICMNNAEEYAECLYYINRLELPKGFQKDVISVTEAPSMAAGYNAGMESSDAKYKVYLHQDVRIINPRFIEGLLQVFESDDSIGILGCVGTTKLGSAAMAVTSWNVGMVARNGFPLLLEYEKAPGLYERVEALDGLLLATQHDVRWREDIMDGWDFYDISQCMEFKRSGYHVVVPRQEHPWCYHDEHSSNMDNYNVYRKRFIDEYVTDGEFQMPAVWADGQEYHKLKRWSVDIMESLIESGNHGQLQQIFKEPQYRRYMHLSEFKVIADIDRLEQQTQPKARLWQPGMDNASDLLNKVRKLKQMVKRIEYRAAPTDGIMDQIMECYSIYAVAGVFQQYVERRQYVYQEIKQYLKQNHQVALEFWEMLERV